MRKLIFAALILLVFVVLCNRPEAQVPVSISPVAKQQFFDASGRPLASGKLYTYSAGTTSPLATYTDSTGVSQNPNPIILDSGGYTPSGLFLSGNSYKFVLKNAAGVTQWTVDGIDEASKLLDVVVKHPTGAALQTIVGPLSLGTYGFTAGSATSKNVNSVLFADQYCTTPSTYDSTCFSNALAALGTSGGHVVVGNHTYNFGSTTLTLAPGNSNVTFSGVCVGNLTTKCPQIIGTANPLIAVTGTNAATRTANVYLENIVFSPVTFNASQICLTADHVTNLVQTNVQYENCGQGEDINDIYGALHFHNAYNNCGSGDTAATACVRAENRSNTGVRSEQIYWDSQSLFQGATHEGIAVYFGPFTSETGIRNSKLDYGSTNPTHRILVWDKSWYGQLSHSSVSAATISTAAGVIVVTGAVADLSFAFNITDNPVISTSASIPAVLVDYGKWGVVGQNTFASPGSNAALVSLSANSLDNIVIGNTNSLSTDTLAVDSGTNNTSCNHKNGVVGLYCGTVYGTTSVIAGKTDGTVGRCAMATGTGSVTGYLECRLANATRLFTFGNSASNAALSLENSAAFTVTGGRSKFDSVGTTSNCSSAASPAVCGSASAGGVAIAAGATTVQVNTTAIANSNTQVFLTRDDSLGSKLSVTCNTQSSLVLGTPRITARSDGVSFTVSIDVGPTTNPMCISYFIVN
jgi:hypothetical protein